MSRRANVARRGDERVIMFGRVRESQHRSGCPSHITSSRMLDFNAIPILDYSLRTANRSAFLAQLRHALINVGFLYLTNHSVDTDLINSLVNNYVPALFALPQDEKDKIRMANSPHFLGYSRLGAELTKGAVDYREQFDIATDHVCRWTGPADPDYYRLWGASQVACTLSDRSNAHW